MKTFAPFARLARRCTPGLLALGSISLSACSHHDADAPQPATIYGASIAIGSGMGRAYINTDAAGNPTEMGLRLTAAALNGLPAQPVMGTMYHLVLPASAAKTPFDHLSFDWNPMGHDPAPQYGVPHFDLHFYMQPMSAQMAITSDDPKGDIFPAAAGLPAGYVTPPNGVPGRTVPMMGRHWIDPSSPEYQPGGSFSSTFIYGTYNGHVTFLEPMFTKAMLTPTVNFSAAIKQPQTYEKTGEYFPTTYTIRYDAAAGEYVISLGGLTLR
ncbi:DUF5602 domain-containing protein [Hymenobacter sp. H14-R3]|uniref:DUF5602 domain-containing protein n=1 Tax=Hymenobacter sp. H14-R3 TaxID=3046308 RepID=UPI0024BBA26E|nr:DUF5602 domain-containing protein [Hymenobacter sp. H14-R3]MDJ0366497.1 DUF5602 domain-containing protein [Hymenobacter sp. H14-R3]